MFFCHLHDFVTFLFSFSNFLFFWGAPCFFWTPQHFFFAFALSLHFWMFWAIWNTFQTLVQKCSHFGFFAFLDVYTVWNTFQHLGQNFLFCTNIFGQPCFLKPHPLKVGKAAYLNRSAIIIIVVVIVVVASKEQDPQGKILRPDIEECNDVPPPSWPPTPRKIQICVLQTSMY